MARKPKPMAKEELASIVSAQIQDADLYETSNVGTDGLPLREWALRFMEGEVDIAPMGEGRSKVVSRDVSDAHGIIMPGLMRTFFSSGRVVEYEPTKAAHEEYADLATDYVNWMVMREANGYREFRNALWDGLLLGNGIMKFWWDDTLEYDIERYSRLDDEQYALILDGLTPDDEIIEHEEYEDADADADEAVGAMGDDDDERALVEPPAGMGGDEPDDGGMGSPAAPMPPMGMPAPPMGQMGQPGPGMMAPGMDTDPLAALAAAMGAMGGMPAMAPPPPPMLHDLKVRRLLTNGRLKLCCIPNEEFLMERDARVIDETVRFCAHKYQATRSHLVEQGFDKDVVADLPTWNDTDVEDQIRDRYLVGNGERAPDTSTEQVEVYECYVLVDADGDGIAERRRVVVAGQSGKRKLLSDEAWEDEIPFADIVPNPRPHTWRGRGLYDDLADLQRIKTVIWRGTLDNVYDVLLPSTEVEEGAYVNLDALYDRKFGEVLIRKRGMAPAVPSQKEFIAPQMMPMMEAVDQVAEKRVGVSVRSQSQNADVLQNQTAQAAQIAQSAMHAKIDEYAQNIAQMGMARIFKCILKLITRHQDRPRQVKIAGEEVSIDPRAWDANLDVTVNTGLGTGSRERDAMALGMVANEQKQIIAQAGPWNDTGVHLGSLFDTLRKQAEALGLRTAESAFPVISEDDVERRRQAMAQQQGQQPNPAMMQTQAEMQVEQMKAQARMALEQQKAQAEQQREMMQAQFDANLAREREAAKLQFQAQMNQMKIALQQQMQDAEIALMEREAAARERLKQREMELEAMLTREANAMKNARVPENPVADTNLRGY